ncbi:MAG: 2,3-bisphosphoglycerate-independent phosphoglycerate mutase [Clostridia bacterium]|nr:2,3-bisphosphoglycerate-independent phosphoglycerate mutase [Clostridia bacterium]
MKKTVALVVIDGFGIGKEDNTNAVYVADMPFYKNLLKTCPHSKLGASGQDVGLKDGQMGNSEVGHLNIGAGRIVSQDMTRIDNAIEDGSFFENKALVSLMEKIKQGNGNLHVMGLMSDGGIHSHIAHLFAVLKMAKKYDINQVYIHFFSDGRDTDIHSAAIFAEQIEDEIREIGIGKIATVGGRFYGMDREQKYDRIKKAYDAIVFGVGENFVSAGEAISKSYQNDVTDEFIVPCTVGDYVKHLPTEKDGFVFINFRKDRTKQITDALTTKGFDKFETKCRFDKYVCMTKYGNYDADIAFEFHAVENSLSEVVSKNGLLQAKFSEPTKYAHVTYFLNGGIEEAFAGEDRFKIPPKNVNTFDEAPEMSAVELAEKFAEEAKKEKYDFMMCNIANGDMVGHTGNFDATVKALEAVDKAVAIITESVRSVGGELLIIADHGNSEKMINENGTVCTTHTTNPVWCIYVGDKKGYHLIDGRLADVSPTILSLLNVQLPKEYTGKILIQKD